MRATPKTSLPIPCANRVRLTILEIDPIAQKRWFQHTITSEGAEGDVLLSGGGSLLGSHCECVDGGCRGWNMEEKKEKFTKLKIKKVGVCPRVLLHGDWPEKSGKRVDRTEGLRHRCGSNVGLRAVSRSASLAYLKFSLLLQRCFPSLPIVRHTLPPLNGKLECSD
jgi:hypothetical protein